LAGLRLLIMDLGGGSAEFILGDRGHARFSQSFPLGCVRLLEKLRPPEHPTATDLSRCRDFIGAFLAERVAPVLEPLLARSSHETILVGTGGTATILARMESKMAGFEREKIEAVRLNRKTVHRWMEHLWSLPLTERKMVVGLPANRADVILLGTAIYATVMAAFALHELRISTRGLRFAALMDAKKSR
jgi:exopolyphosphatase/guanosine-5'-triphosphate,3'-diphosphate pyrophosphatase